jgi:hypothetical protein
MKLKVIYKIASIILMIGLTNSIFCQELEGDQQEIIKSFEATLEDATMIKIEPKINPIQPSKIVYKYNLTIVPIELKYPDPIIKPLAPEPAGEFVSKPFYAELGYGNVRNPHLLLRYFKTDKNDLTYFLNADYNGLNSSPELPNQSMRNGKLNLGLEYRLSESLLVDAKFKTLYDRRKVFFIDSSYLSDASILGKNRNTIGFGGEANISNASDEDPTLRYKGGVNASVLNTTLEKETETLLGANLEISKETGAWFINIPFEVKTTLRNVYSDLLTLSLDPTVKYSNDNIWAKIGFGLINDASLKTKVFPKINLDYSLSDKYLHLFVNVDQQQFTNNLHNFLLVNPWVNSQVDTLSTHLSQSFSGGIKGDDKSFGYQVEGGYAKHYNLGSFTNVDRNAFATLNAFNVNAVFLRGNIDFAVSNKISVGGTFNKNFYSKKVYGIHALELKAYTKIGLFKNKLVLSPSLFIADRVTALTSIGDVKLNNQVELNIGTKINIADKFGIYFDANNLLNNKYARFYGYPSIGLHFNGGVLLKF